jgi:hypothetical protein
MTMEKQIERMRNAFVQDKQWTDIVKNYVEDGVDNKTSGVAAEVVLLHLKLKPCRKIEQNRKNLAREKQGASFMDCMKWRFSNG